MARVEANRFLVVHAKGGVGGVLRLEAEVGSLREAQAYMDQIIDKTVRKDEADEVVYVLGPVMRMHSSLRPRLVARVP